MKDENEREKVKKFLEHGLNVFEVFDCMTFALRSFYIGLEKMKGRGVSEEIINDQKGMMIFVLHEFVQSLYIFCFKKELTEEELKKHCSVILDRVIELFEKYPDEEVSKDFIDVKQLIDSGVFEKLVNRSSFFKREIEKEEQRKKKK